MTLRLGQSAALPGLQIAFQINTVLVNVLKPHYTALVNKIKPHYPALVNITGYAHGRVIIKTAFLRAMQFAKASGAAHGALAECAVTLRLGQSAALPGLQIAFQINTVLVNVLKPHYTALVNKIKPHYPALVNMTGHVRGRVIIKTAFLRAMQFAKASGAAHGAKRSVP